MPTPKCNQCKHYQDADPIVYPNSVKQGWRDCKMGRVNWDTRACEEFTKVAESKP